MGERGLLSSTNGLKEGASCCEISHLGHLKRRSCEASQNHFFSTGSNVCLHPICDQTEAPQYHSRIRVFISHGWVISCETFPRTRLSFSFRLTCSAVRKLVFFCEISWAWEFSWFGGGTFSRFDWRQNLVSVDFTSTLGHLSLYICHARNFLVAPGS